MFASKTKNFSKPTKNFKIEISIKINYCNQSNNKLLNQLSTPKMKRTKEWKKHPMKNQQVFLLFAVIIIKIKILCTTKNNQNI